LAFKESQWSPRLAGLVNLYSRHKLANPRLSLSHPPGFALAAELRCALYTKAALGILFQWRFDFGHENGNGRRVGTIY
jgi:hypothetical protein